MSVKEIIAEIIVILLLVACSYCAVAILSFIVCSCFGLVCTLKIALGIWIVWLSVIVTLIGAK